jgi:hypothetical protein
MLCFEDTHHGNDCKACVHFSYSSEQSVSLGNQVVLNVHSVIKVITESLLTNRVFLQNLGGVLALSWSGVL